MNIREQIEKRESELLSKYATLNINSRGRKVDEPPCDIRPLFSRDRDRIIHSKAFRRLKNKTQVFLAPKGDHYRTRLSHTLEVSQNARTIAKALRLNEDLVEAIALGHDLGHTPYGHAGESALAQVAPCGFVHSEQSVRICELLEKDGKGLNLSWEVLDGIKNHRTGGKPSTPEGQIVRIADKVAYVNSDIDDAIRAGLLTEEDIPKEIRNTLGDSVRKRLNTLIHDLITNSMDKPDIEMSAEIGGALKDLRAFLFESVYKNPTAKSEEVKAKRMIVQMYKYYDEFTEELPPKFLNMIEHLGERKDRVICDYISGMTDQFANEVFGRIFVPMSWEGWE